MYLPLISVGSEQMVFDLDQVALFVYSGAEHDEIASISSISRLFKGISKAVKANWLRSRSNIINLPINLIRAFHRTESIGLSSYLRFT